jgi:hypothetical protein
MLSLLIIKTTFFFLVYSLACFYILDQISGEPDKEKVKNLDRWHDRNSQKQAEQTADIWYKADQLVAGVTSEGCVLLEPYFF